MAPLLTIAIPFFDEELRLGDAIRSVLGQTFADFELFLVDDGSRDASLAVARAFDDPRITVISDGARKGLPARLNEINARARTSLVARMDADDVMHPTRISRQLAWLEQNPSYEILGTRVVFVDERDEPFAMSDAPALPATLSSVLRGGTVAHPTVLGHRSVFVEHPYDERFTRAEDRELWCRIAPTTKIGFLDEPLHVMRVCATDGDFLPGYLTSQRQNREIFRRFGPSAFGHTRTALYRAASLGKEWIMRGLVRAGRTKPLLQRRGAPPDTTARAMAKQALLAARQRP